MEFLNRYRNVVHWLPRASLASIFLYHGLSKFSNIAMMSEMMGMPEFMIVMVALMELAAATFILFGALGRELFTRLAGLLISAVMLGALGMFHIKNGWNGVFPEIQGVELQLFILTAGIYFLVRGNDPA